MDPLKKILAYKKQGIEIFKKQLTGNEISLMREIAKKNLSHRLLLFGNSSEKAIKNIRLILLKHIELLRGESRLTQALFMGILENLDTKKFLKFAGNNLYGSNLSRILTVHNSLIREEFTRNKLDWKSWHFFNEKTEIVSMDREKNNSDVAWALLAESLEGFKIGSQNTVLGGSIRKDIMAILKEKKRILKGEFLLPEDNWQRFLFPTFCKGVDYYKRRGKNIIDSGELMRIAEIKYLLEGFYKKPVKKVFTVQLWDRYPMRDLLQGNFSNCCIAIGERDLFPAVNLPGTMAKKRPAGVLEYLVDFGVQAAEIADETDKDKKEIVGQCWIFGALVDKEPVLMVDSIEIDRQDVSSPIQLEAIKEAARIFLKKYAAEVGFKKVYLGKTGPILGNGKRHIIRNDVNTDDLNYVCCKSIKKIGGYCFNKPYFLEAIGGRTAYILAKNSRLEIWIRKLANFIKSNIQFEIVSERAD